VSEVKREVVLKKALKVYGEPAQLMMLQEEMGELIQQVSKIYREKSIFSEIVDEIADVRIMIDQLILILQSKNKKRQVLMEIKEREKFKIQRLSDNLIVR